MEYMSNSCENEVKEDLEDGEIFDEDNDVDMGESTDQNTESKMFEDNCFEKGAKVNDFEPQWDMEQQSHKEILPGVSPFPGFYNSGLRGERFSRNKGAIMKRNAGYIMDDDIPGRKRQRFDHVDEKDSMLISNQNGIFNRKKNDSSMNSIEDTYDEDMLYARGSNPNELHFETFPQEFENEAGDFRPEINNFGQNEKGKQVGGGMDRCGRGMSLKRQMGHRLIMKNKRTIFKEKICQNFLQGKCLKGNNCTCSHQRPSGQKMELCKFYLMGCCSKNDRCTFMHSEFPCKYFHTGLKCYSGANCRFSHAKLDENQKKQLPKSFGKLWYDPPEFENENEDYKNKFEEVPKPVVENNFNSKSDKNIIPSLLEMQIPVPPEIKHIKNNSEYNSNIYNNNTPMLSLSREESTLDDTFEINDTEQPEELPELPKNNISGHKSKRHQNKNKNNKERQMHKKELKRLKRHIEKQLEKNRQLKEKLTTNTNNLPLFDDLSDDDKFNELVIDEEKFNNDEKYQQLPKKQKELFKRIQVKQKSYNETSSNESFYNQEEQYSSDVSDHPVSSPTLVNLSQSEEDKKQSVSCYLAKSGSSKVEKIDFSQITISYDEMERILNSIKVHIGSEKSTEGENSSPFHLPPLQQHYSLKENTDKNSKFIDEKSSDSATDAMESEKSGVDIGLLPFQFPLIAATEIDASLGSHAPIKYQMIPIEMSVPNYSKIFPSMRINDPRLRRSVTNSRDPMFMFNIFATGKAETVARRDPRKL